MPMGAIVGGLAGLAVAWLIAASKSRFRYLGGSVGEFEGLGCFATLLLSLASPFFRTLLEFTCRPYPIKVTAHKSLTVVVKCCEHDLWRKRARDGVPGYFEHISTVGGNY